MSADPSPRFYVSSHPLAVGTGPHVDVTAHTHPLVFQAFETISADSGYGCGRDRYAVPADWAERLASSERGLARLPDADSRQEFAIGEDGDARSLAEADPDLAVAHALLDAFFDGPEKTTEPQDAHA
jgi:hypothetical protein